MELYKTKDGSELAVVAATWEVNRKITFDSLAPEFKRNPAQAWRNYGSRVSGQLVDTALKDPNLVAERVNVFRDDPWDYARNKLKEHVRGVRGRRYFMHFDLAKNKDKAGIALCHLEATNVIVADFLHAVAAKPGKNIDFESLRDFVYDFHARGFAIEMVTYDQWQSEDSRQTLEKKGFQTDYCSADKSTGPYDTLIELLIGYRYDFYNHPIFMREMKQLRTNGLKYDHPKGGSKDVSDAAACSAFTCLKYERENPKEAPGKVKVVRQGARSRLTTRYEKSVW